MYHLTLLHLRMPFTYTTLACHSVLHASLMHPIGSLWREYTLPLFSPDVLCSPSFWPKYTASTINYLLAFSTFWPLPNFVFVAFPFLLWQSSQVPKKERLRLASASVLLNRHTQQHSVLGDVCFMTRGGGGGGGGRIVQHTITYGLHPSLSLVSWPSHNNQWHCFIFILIHHLSRQKPNVMCHSDICSKWIITQSHLHTFVSLQVSVVVQHTSSSKKS